VFLLQFSVRQLHHSLDDLLQPGRVLRHLALHLFCMQLQSLQSAGAGLRQRIQHRELPLLLLRLLVLTGWRRTQTTLERMVGCNG
jgi:hypothetical protein